MRSRTTKRFARGLAAVAAVACVAVAGMAVAEEPEGGGMPPMQKKVDHPLAKALVGTWNVAHTSEGHPATTGTVTFALGVGDTALMQDYSVSMGAEGSFVGHGVWKLADDGKTIQCWWIDMFSPGMQRFEGSLADTGFDVKSEDGTRLTLAKTATGYEFLLYMGGSDKPAIKDVWTKK